MALICDTGPLLASLDLNDPDHRRCRDMFEASTEDLIIPGLVLAEVGYWCEKLDIAKSWLQFQQDIANGAAIVDWPTAADLRRSFDLQRKYRGVGIVDTSILAVVERWNEPKLATLDHRHFRTMKPLHVAALTLFP